MPGFPKPPWPSAKAGYDNARRIGAATEMGRVAVLSRGGATIGLDQAQNAKKERAPGDALFPASGLASERGAILHLSPDLDPHVEPTPCRPAAILVKLGHAG